MDAALKRAIFISVGSALLKITLLKLIAHAARSQGKHRLYRNY